MESESVRKRRIYTANSFLTVEQFSSDFLQDNVVRGLRGNSVQPPRGTFREKSAHRRARFKVACLQRTPRHYLRKYRSREKKRRRGDIGEFLGRFRRRCPQVMFQRTRKEAYPADAYPGKRAHLAYLTYKMVSVFQLWRDNAWIMAAGAKQLFDHGGYFVSRVKLAPRYAGPLDQGSGFLKF